MSIEDPKQPENKAIPLINKNELTLIKEESEENKSYHSITSYIRKERTAILYAILSHFIWAVGVIFIRLPTRTENFTANSFIMFRSAGLCILCYIIMKYKQMEIINIYNINQKGWFIIRTCGIYFAFLFYLIELLYLRLSTASCLGGCSPFVIMGLSAVILKEKLYMRHIVGMVLCFIGGSIIVMNENKDNTNNTNINNNNLSDTYIGVIMGILNFVCWGSASFTQKLFIINKLNTENQLFYIGLSNTILGIIGCIVQQKIGNSILNIICALSHSVVFYLGTLTTDWALKLMDASKFAPTIYINTLMVFCVSVLVFNESLYFTDIIGSLLIVSYHIYNALYPIV